MPIDRKPEDLVRRMAEFAGELKRLAVELRRDLRKKPPAPSVTKRLAKVRRDAHSAARWAGRPVEGTRRP